MVSAVRLVLAEIFTGHVNSWIRYVDDTISIVKETLTALVLTVLNKFHENIEFTCKVKENEKIVFLDILMVGNNNFLKTTAYRKIIHNRVYLHWKSFVPPTWKCGTLHSIIQEFTESAQFKNI